MSPISKQRTLTKIKFPDCIPQLSINSILTNCVSLLIVNSCKFGLTS